MRRATLILAAITTLVSLASHAETTTGLNSALSVSYLKHTLANSLTAAAVPYAGKDLEVSEISTQSRVIC